MSADETDRLFAGEFKALVGRRNRIVIPSRWRWDSGTPYFQVPCGDCLAFLPAPAPQPGDADRTSLLRAVRFSEVCRQVIAESKIYLTEPTFLDSRLSASATQRLARAIQEIEDAKSHISKMTGREFEKFLRRVFTFAGASVQSNIRLLGAEIDLMLLEVDDENRPKFTIIEIKNNAASGRHINVSVVLRLFGLESALRTMLPIKNSFIVSTTDFTHPAVHFANIYQVGLRELDQLKEWLSAHSLEWHTRKAPCYDFSRQTKHGDIRIPQAFRKYVEVGREAVWVGGRGSFELWSREALDRAHKEEVASYETVAAVIGL